MAFLCEEQICLADSGFRTPPFRTRWRVSGRTWPNNNSDAINWVTRRDRLRRRAVRQNDANDVNGARTRRDAPNAD